MKTLVIAADAQRRRLLGDALRRQQHEVTVLESAEAPLPPDGYPLVIFDTQGTNHNNSPLPLAGEGSGVRVSRDETRGPGETAANGAFARFCRRLRDRSPSHDCLLVAVGDGSSLAQVEELLRAGADDYWGDVQDAARLDARLAVARRRAQRLTSAGKRGDAATESFSAYYPLAHDAPYGVYRSSLEGRFLEVNATLVDMLGYDSAEELLAIDVVRDLYCDPQQRRQAIGRVLAMEGSGQIKGIPFEWRRKNGTPITALAYGRPLRDAAGNIVQFEGIIHDITERSKADRALRESESKFRSLFENIPDFILVVDPDATIRLVNHRSDAALPEVLIGSVGFNFLTPECQAECRRAFQHTVSTGEVQMVTALSVFGRWWGCRLVPWIVDEKVQNVTIICTDITEHKNSYEAIRKERQLLRELLDLNERERRLIAYEIHDGFSQQLVGALLQFESCAQSHASLPIERRKAFDAGLKLLRQSIDETRRLISGLRPPILDEFGVVAAIEYLLCEDRQQTGMAIDFFHEIQFDRLAAPLESAIFRIAQESLTNACRHSQSERVRVDLVQTGDRIRLSVQDWGVGFDPQQVAEHRFGLQGIRERARLLDGCATIESTPGSGTLVSADLPLVEPAPEGE